MESIVEATLEKLKWIDQAISSYSVYNRNSKIKQNWKEIDASIITIINNTISKDAGHLSSQKMIAISSTSTLLSSMIYAFIVTQRLSNIINVTIEKEIIKQIETVLYHIQQLQYHRQTNSVAFKGTQAAIIYHISSLVDALSFYSSVQPVSQPQLYPPKALLPSNRRYSQPILISNSPSEESMSLAQNNDFDFRDRATTVSKKIMKGIHSLKPRPVFYMTRLSNKHSVEPMMIDPPPIKKKRVDREKSIGTSALYWDDEVSSEDSNNKTKFGGSTTLRLLFGNKQQQHATGSIKKSKGIKDLFQTKEGSFTKKRESISNLFSSQKYTVKGTMISDTSSLRETSSITSHDSSKILYTTDDPPFITSSSLSTQPSIKKALHWTELKIQTDPAIITTTRSRPEEKNNSNTWESTESTRSSKDINSCEILSTEKGRKRRSNGALVINGLNKLQDDEFSSGASQSYDNNNQSDIIQEEVVMSGSPESFYFSAKSSTSSHYSMGIDELSESLANVQIKVFESDVLDSFKNIPSPTQSLTQSREDSEDIKIELTSEDDLFEQYNYSHINKKEEEQRSIKKKRISFEVDDNSVLKMEKKKNSFDYPTKITIPPRRSSIPLTKLSPLPNTHLTKEAKRKTLTSYTKRPSRSPVDESNWNVFLGVPPKKAKKIIDSKLIEIVDNGDITMLLEVMDGKTQVVVAGTCEKLFEKLIDEETSQDLDYIDIFITNHSNFITSLNLLNQLTYRFYLEPSTGEYAYVKKCSLPIQIRILNVLYRWISIQYQDYKLNHELYIKLDTFIKENSVLHFKNEFSRIQNNIIQQKTRFSDFNYFLSSTTTTNNSSNNTSHSLSLNTFNFSFSSNKHQQQQPFPVAHIVNPRRPSTNIFHLSPPQSPTVYSTSNTASLLHLESKDIARYLTLADYYLFKSIQSYDFLYPKKNSVKNDYDFIDIMTTRANMMSHWIAHEIYNVQPVKIKRVLLRKFIEIAKFCLDYNNFHTCMVITMGLLSGTVQRLEETWQMLSSKDMNTFSSLQKLLDVSLNMRYYRQKLQLAKSPCVPFLPVVLKDRTFFIEGNQCYLNSYPNLINFSKFRSIQHFLNGIKLYTGETYWFANELDHFPFFPLVVTQRKHDTNNLNEVADWIENRLNLVKTCYNQCDLTDAVQQ